MSNNGNSNNIFSLLLLFAVVLTSCSTTKKLMEADYQYEAGEYSDASASYRRLGKKIKRRDVKSRTQFRTGESYFKLGNYKSASNYYRSCINRSYSDSIVRLRYAESLKAIGEYEAAVVHYNIYLSDTTDNIERERATFGLIGAELALGDIASNIAVDKSLVDLRAGDIEVAKVKGINSTESDYAPIYMGSRGNQILFSSSRRGSSGGAKSAKSSVTGRNEGDIFKTWYDIQREKWEKPKLLEEELTVNSEYDDGAAILGAQGSMLFYSSARETSTGAIIPSILCSKGSGSEWSDPKRLNIVPDTVMAAHPSLSYDDRKLYFVSDMAGGYGGNDIWVVEQDGDSWSEPINLGGEINTPGDEMFPHVRESGDIYFSSDYHIGYGGFDIFKAVLTTDTETDLPKWVVTNMGQPLNSSGDDISISFLAGEDRGLFSSRRDGDRSDEIYSFNIPKIVYNIEGSITDLDSGEKLSGVILRLIGTDGTLKRLDINSGTFNVDIDVNSHYVVIAHKNGYLNDKALCNTIGLEGGKQFSVALKLKSTDKPIEVESIYFDFASAKLKEESKGSLDSLILVLKDNPTISIELGAHSDDVGEDKFNMKLSQDRATSVVNYIVSKGVNSSRVEAKGYGESQPRVVTERLAKKYRFLDLDRVLSVEYVNSLSEENRDICRQLNRRIEFKVTSREEEQ